VFVHALMLGEHKANFHNFLPLISYNHEWAVAGLAHHRMSSLLSGEIPMQVF
jgi:hypothetical protein